MPVNCADMMFFGAVLLYPVAAARGAVASGHPWAAVLLAPVGFAVGLAFTLFSQRLFYLVLEPVLKYGEACKGWIQIVLGLPLFGLYLLLPLVIIGAELYATNWGSSWLVRHVFQ